MKSKRAQVVPLSTQAVELFKRALELAGNSEYVFPSDIQRAHGFKPKLKHLAPTSVSHAMSKVTTGAKIEDARIHDLRKVVASWLLENGVGMNVVNFIRGTQRSKADSIWRRSLQPRRYHWHYLTTSLDLRGPVF